MDRVPNTPYVLKPHRPMFQRQGKYAKGASDIAMGRKQKKDKIVAELKALGVSAWGLIKAESRYLPNILHDNEQLKGVVYGHHHEGSAMLVATDLRLMFLDVKPFYIKTDELTYDVVSGVSYGNVALFSTVTLHTRLSDYTIRTMNFRAARRFIEYIETHCVEKKQATWTD